MAALNFPNSPSTNDLHTENGVTFKWNGTIWKKVGSAYTDATNLNVTGISTVGSITGVAATFTGNVQIGGVLTYEDVRNIDSIGIITARNRINMPQGYHVGWLSGSTYRARIHGDSGNNFIVENGSSNVERVRINSAGKVGIGTNNPGNTVHIGGTQGVGARWHNYTSGNSAYLTLESGDKFQSNVGGSGEYAWVSAGGTKMTLTNAGKLDITGGIIARAVTDSFTLNTQNQPHYGFNLSSTSSVPIGMSGYYGIAFATEGAERLRILRNGDVGISHQLPSAGLHIKRQGRNFSLNEFYDGYASDSGIGGYVGSIVGSQVGERTHSLILESTTTAAADRGSSIGFRAKSGDTLIDVTYAAIVGAKENSVTDNSPGTTYDDQAKGYLSFYTSNQYAYSPHYGTHNIERLRITSGGKVGIGSVIPEQRLTVAGVTDITHYNNSTINNNRLQLGFNAPEGYIKAKNSAASPAANLALYTTDTSGNTNKVVHCSYTGDIGVGIDSPGAPLHAYHATTNTIAQFQSGDAGAGILLKDNTHYTRLESTNGIFKIDIDAGGSLSDGEDLFLQRSGTNFFKSHHDGYQGPIPRHGTMQGTYVYRQRNQSANYEHKIRGPMSGYLDTEMDSNFVAYIKVQCIGTGTNNAYCYYRLGQDGENLGATLTHIHGNSGSNSNLPWMVLDGQHACWKTAHSVAYHYIIRVEVTGGKNQCTYTTDSDYGAN